MAPTRMGCEYGRLHVEGAVYLPPLARLGGEDRRLAEGLILCGCNLKTLAERFEITYPTLRKRLDSRSGDWRTSGVGIRMRSRTSSVG